MQMAITFIAVVAGMIFSLAVALLAEELIFGQVFRLFFSRPTAAKPGTKKLGPAALAVGRFAAGLRPGWTAEEPALSLSKGGRRNMIRGGRDA
jgi:hypothetical protein